MEWSEMLNCRFMAALLAGLTVGGCASDPSVGPRQESGAVAGALAGGALGALLGGRGTGNRVAGAVIGAAAGGILGGAVGASLDERDRRLAYEAEMRALDSGEAGAPVGWQGQGRGVHGTVVPGPYYVNRGMRCREYTHTIYIDGRPQTARSTACRNPDGTWTPVG
jgi:surface antigen